MSETKKSSNPFINMANAAKATAATPRVPGSTATKVQQAKFGSRVQSNKPTKRSAGRGR